MATLRFDDATIREIGASLTSNSQSLDYTTQWNNACDLGDEGLNDLLAQVRSTINNGTHGAQTALFSLGSAAIDSADAWTAADHAQAG